MMTDKLLSIRSACDRLAISRWTLRRIEAEGKLQRVQIGSLVRYRETDIADIIEGRKSWQHSGNKNPTSLLQRATS